MFMTGSRTENFESGRLIKAADDAIVVVSNGDLFSDFLIESLIKKFPNCDVVTMRDIDAMRQDDVWSAKLVLLYHVSATDIQAVLDVVRSRHPTPSIGLVVEAVGTLESGYIGNLVETRVIDGVLPLNLRLDVFMAAVDLLMKGGEHFPAALLSRLAAHPPTTAMSSQQRSPATSGSISGRNSSFPALTTREVQILNMICKGTQNKIIADRLHLSENTVKVHVRNIYKKMNVRNRTEAASRFFDSEGGFANDKTRN